MHRSVKIAVGIVLVVGLCLGLIAFAAAQQQNFPSGLYFNACGNAVACAVAPQSNPKAVWGSAPLSSGTPSTAVLTGLPFASSTSYRCIASDTTTITSNIVATYTSGASATLTGPATVSDTVQYICIGN